MEIPLAGGGTGVGLAASGHGDLIGQDLANELVNLEEEDSNMSEQQKGAELRSFGSSEGGPRPAYALVSAGLLICTTCLLFTIIFWQEA